MPAHLLGQSGHPAIGCKQSPPCEYIPNMIDPTEDSTGITSADNPITLPFEDEKKEQVIDLNDGRDSPIPSAAIADKKTSKFLEGFPDVDLTSDGIRAEILSGGEDSLRERLARQRDIDFRQRKLDVINKMASDRAAKGERLTPEEADLIMGLSQRDAKHDPQTIMETEYARQFFNKIASRKKA